MSERFAIQTEYNGYVFRSRLEAHWAIFLDHMSAAYNYESEGFDLNGLWYLPDFHLRDGIRLYGEEKRLNNVWVEIKPSMRLGESEKQKIGKFVKKTGNVILLVTGDPDPNAEMRLISYVEYGGGWVAPIVRWVELEDGELGLLKQEGMAVDPNVHGVVGARTKTDNLMAAFGGARRARFEFGESPDNQSIGLTRDCGRCRKAFVAREDYYSLCDDCYWTERKVEHTTQVGAVTATEAVTKRATLPRWTYGIGALVAVMILLFAGLGAMADGREPDRAAVPERGSVNEAAVIVAEATATETSTTMPTEIATQAPLPTATNSATSTTVPTNTTDPTNTPSPTRTSKPAILLVKVAVSSANLRNGPGTNYGIAKVGFLDDEFEVLGRTRDGDWFNAMAKDGAKFWVAKSVLNAVADGSLSGVGIVSTIPAPPEPTKPLLPTATSIPPTPIVPVATIAPTEAPVSRAPEPAQECDPSYPNVCIPPKSKVGDLNCGDISFRRFQVIGSDPHGFDRDNDGIGCESG